MLHQTVRDKIHRHLPQVPDIKFDFQILHMAISLLRLQTGLESVKNRQQSGVFS